MDFPCTCCGACCRNVNLAAETRWLDRGDGCCLHYEERSKLCSIYEVRPDICRVDVQFKSNYQKSMDWVQFVNLNLQACELLRNSTPPPQSVDGKY